MYQIKTCPEDFIVEEITNIQPSDGPYTYFWLKKRDYTTLKALAAIARQFHKPLKDFSFAGTKDRIAITTQLCSAKMLSKEKVEQLNLKDISVEYFGQGPGPLSLGDLKGNRFTITVRNLDELKTHNIQKVPNAFGEQRFSKNNVKIGRAIIKKNFKLAASLIDDISIKAYLEQHPKDPIGALRRVNRKLLKMFVHAYQSFIWNRALEQNEDEELAIVGFGTEEIDPATQRIMEEEGITFRDFIIPQLPELSAEGGTRKTVVDIKGFCVLAEGPDDLHPGKFMQKIAFDLPKGSYATVVVEALYK